MGKPGELDKAKTPRGGLCRRTPKRPLGAIPGQPVSRFLLAWGYGQLYRLRVEMGNVRKPLVLLFHHSLSSLT
jgi:hypothetical protein